MNHRQGNNRGQVLRKAATIVLASQMDEATARRVRDQLCERHPAMAARFVLEKSVSGWHLLLERPSVEDIHSASRSIVAVRDGIERGQRMAAKAREQKPC